MILGTIQTFPQENKKTANLQINPYFEFHSFISHLEGKPVSYASNNIDFWYTDSWGDIEVERESHVVGSIRPKFSSHNLVAIMSGKKICQFFTPPEAGLAHGEHINLLVYGYQDKGNILKAKIQFIRSMPITCFRYLQNNQRYYL
jgi:hypothetical protein